MKGAPIRFVAAVVGGWVCVRIAVLLPEAERLASDVLAPPAAARGRMTTRGTAEPAPPMLVPAMSSGTTNPAALRSGSAGEAATALAGAQQQRPFTEPDRPISRDDGKTTPAILVSPIVGLPPTAADESRWAASGWLLARGGASGTLTGGRLGASQAGTRITYLLERSRRIALAARVATPLRGRGTEAAVGVDWQPTPAPVHLVVEQRVAIDGARGGPTALVIAGLNPTPVAAGFRLEAYAQGGAILRGGRAEAFGDGAARLARPVAALGGTTFDLGVGAWVAGQRGAARVDVGPSVGVAVPVAGNRIRVSLDWRQRVAGDARPGSGPALSIGSDF